MTLLLRTTVANLALTVGIMLTPTYFPVWAMLLNAAAFWLVTFVVLRELKKGGK